MGIENNKAKSALRFSNNNLEVATLIATDERFAWEGRNYLSYDNIFFALSNFIIYLFNFCLNSSVIIKVFLLSIKSSFSLFPFSCLFFFFFGLTF